MPTIATGTIHSGSRPAVKPWSSSGFISSGIKGSVAAPINEPMNATRMPMRPCRKYGAMRAKRCGRVSMGGGEAAGRGRLGGAGERAGDGPMTAGLRLRRRW